MPVTPQKLDRVVFHQLKGLMNLDISVSIQPLFRRSNI